MTPLMHRTMLFLESYAERSGGVSPSVREIAAHLGERVSTSVAARALDGLEKRGLIRRLPYRARAIEIVRPISRTAVYAWDDESKSLRPHPS